MSDRDDRAHGETLAAIPSTADGARAGATGEMSAPAPQIVAGRYEILGLLGVGGMGSVYKVRDLSLDEVVALKILRRDWIGAPGALERFRREVKLARRVTHRNVARTFDLGEDATEKFLTMELIDGPSLSRLLDERGALPVAEALRIAHAIADALAAAHAAGVVHRDLKPDNVLVEKGGRVVVTDFGIARGDTGDVGMTGAGALIGTPAYMAPEQVEGRPVDARSDVYALGLVLYEMLTGARAWPGDSPFAVASARLVRPAPVPQRADLPAALVSLVARVLAKSPDERPDSAERVRSELAVIEANAVSASLGTAVPLPPPTLSHAARTLAVMPLRATGAQEHAWVAESFTDDLLDGLCVVRELRVRARAAALPHEDAQAFGARLGVELVVEGSVRREGDGVRIQLRLSSAADGFQVWAARLVGSVGELLLLADRAARDIADAVGASSRTPAPTRPGVDARALELHAHARRLAVGSAFETTGGLAEIVEAVALAPAEPRILATYSMLSVRESFRPGSDTAALLAQARRAVDRAIDVAPELPEPWVALAQLRMNTGDTLGAARAVRRALRAGPSMGEAHDVAGRLLAEAGRLEDARALLTRAIWLDPLINLAHIDLVRVLGMLGRLGEALAQLDRLATHIPVMHLMAAYRYDRWWPDAGIVIPEYSLPPGSLAARLADGNRELRSTRALSDEHRTVLDQGFATLPPGTRPRRFVGQSKAEMHAYLHQHDEAMNAIESSVSDGLEDIVWLDRCPLLAPLHGTPRYEAARAIVRQRAAAVLAAWDAA